MRRHEKEVKDLQEIEAIIKRAEVCRLAMCVNNQPYIVPMNFGYQDHCLYFHCAKEGRKLEMLRENPKVCFEIEVDTELIKADLACECSMRFMSVIGFGTASILEDFENKKAGLDILMSQYSKQQEIVFDERAVQRIVVIKVDIQEMSCKKSGY